MKVYLLLNVELGTTQQVLKTLREIPNLSANQVFGAYDIICTIYGEDVETLKDIIQWKIRKMKQVKSMLSLISTSTVKISEESGVIA